MSFNPPLEMFQHIIQQQRPRDDWTMSIFDRKGVNIARFPNPEQTIGSPGSPALLAVLLTSDEGKLLTTVSREGVALNTSFTRSPLTGWKVVAGTPVAGTDRAAVARARHHRRASAASCWWLACSSRSTWRRGSRAAKCCTIC